MALSMTIQDVKKIADLARLELTHEELELYAGQLSNILAYVNQLQELDTKDVPITAQVTGLSNVFREDVVTECEVKREILGQAPDRDGDGVKVKSVF